MNYVILSLLHTYTLQFGLPISAWFGRRSQKGLPYPFLSCWPGTSFVSIHLHIVDCLGLMSLCIIFRETDYKIILTMTLCWIGFASHNSCLRFKVPERKINKLYSTLCFRMSDGWTILLLELSTKSKAKLQKKKEHCCLVQHNWTVVLKWCYLQ